MMPLAEEGGAIRLPLTRPLLDAAVARYLSHAVDHADYKWRVERVGRDEPHFPELIADARRGTLRVPPGHVVDADGRPVFTFPGPFHFAVGGIAGIIRRAVEAHTRDPDWREAVSGISLHRNLRNLVTSCERVADAYGSATVVFFDGRDFFQSLSARYALDELEALLRGHDGHGHRHLIHALRVLYDQAHKHPDASGIQQGLATSPPLAGIHTIPLLRELRRLGSAGRHVDDFWVVMPPVSPEVSRRRVEEVLGTFRAATGGRTAAHEDKWQFGAFSPDGGFQSATGVPLAYLGIQILGRERLLPQEKLMAIQADVEEGVKDPESIENHYRQVLSPEGYARLRDSLGRAGRSMSPSQAPLRGGR